MNLSLLQVPADESHWYVRVPKGVVPFSRYVGPKPEKDKIYASVTTVIGGGIPKPFPYYKWLAGRGSWAQAEREVKDAQERGLRVHDALESLGLDPKVKVKHDAHRPEEWDMIWGIFRGLRTVGVKKVDPKCVECLAYDDEDHTAGTVDLYASVGKEKWVIDYKTSKLIKLEHKIQVMKYGTMLRKMGKTVDRVCVIRSAERAEDGNEVWIGKIDEDYLAAFEHARWMFWFLNPKAGPKMKEIPEFLSLSLL